LYSFSNKRDRTQLAVGVSKPYTYILGACYGKVDRAIIEDPTLTPESRLIYACLACYADKKRSCYPSIETLIKVSGMSKTRFYKHMDLLVNRGIVEKIKLKNGNLYGRNIYKLCDFSRNPQNKEVKN